MQENSVVTAGAPDDGNYLSRSTDHLANMASQLADLIGYPVLAFELIQNADDGGAELLSLRVLDDRLEVWNDKPFTDCGSDADDCQQDPRCDFHSFRLVGSGNKAGRSETTGKFGIGFTAVYQVTDHPELISAGRHWILDEAAPEGKRIRVCKGGCGLAHDSSGTLFVLPYAMDESLLRERLNVRALTDEDPGFLAADLTRVVPDAMLFLRHVSEIEVDHGGKRYSCQRVAEPRGRVTISDGTVRRTWHLLETDFAAAAAGLRERHAGRIEEGRGSRVRVAVSDGPSEEGLLHAGLPTESKLPGLPVRIDAEFFPTRDRKEVHFNTEYLGEWNQAALRAAAEVIADHLESVFDIIGAEGTWRLVEAAYRLDRGASLGHETVFSEFWQALQRVLRSAKIVPVLGGRVRASQGLKLPPVRQGQAAVLDVLGLDVPDDTAREVLFRLPSDVTGHARMSKGDLIEAAASAGLTGTWTPGQDEALLSADQLDELLRIVQDLPAPPNDRNFSAALPSVAIIPCESGRVCRLSDVCRTDADDSRELLRSVDLPIEVADEARLKKTCPFLIEECPVLGPGLVIRLLAPIARRMEVPQAVLALRWFNARQGQLTPEHQRTIVGTALFPTSGTLRPLNDLVLPGGFTDPLGLATVIDLSALDGLTDFLKFLGARQLDPATYLTEHAAPHVHGGRLTEGQARQLIDIIAHNMSDFEKSDRLREILQDLRLIRCGDGVFRQGTQVYFQGAAVAGWDVPQLDTPDSQLSKTLTRVYEWLGVAWQGRMTDVVARAEALARPDVAVSAVEAASFLSDLARHDEARDWVKRGRLNSLKSLQWLPGEQGGRFTPNAIYLVFNRHLFATQGPFLDTPYPVQREASDLLYDLGVPQGAPLTLVVRHLQECTARGLSIDNRIYRYLADHERAGTLGDRVVAQLREIAFIQTEAGYHRPDEVFWDESPFGMYSIRLSESLREYTALFATVGVKSTPDHRDAVRVLKRIAVDWRNDVLDDNQFAVVHACWSRIQAHLVRVLPPGRPGEEAWLRSELAAVHCIPDSRSVLERPETLLFQDPAGIGVQSSLLKNSLIDRHLDTRIGYQAVGVRDVSDPEILRAAVNVEDPMSPDAELEHALAEREMGIRRVLEAHDQVDSTTALARLATLQTTSAADILVRHEIHAFKQIESLTPVHAACHYRSDEHQLTRRRASAQEAGWDDVARELAVAIAPEAHLLAGNLFLVLSASDAASASRVLSTLGIPTLSNVTVEEVAQREVGTLGTEGDGDEAPGEADARVAETVTPGPDEESIPEQAETPSQTGSTTPADPTGANGAGRTDANSGRAPGPDGQSAGSFGTGADQFGGRSSTTGVKAPSPRHNRMLSYVLHGHADDDQPRGDEARDYSEVDRCGVQAALDYETLAGRVPHELPHNNPGFDIKSEGADGVEVRRIEVKSLEGEWGPRGVALTRQQYKENERVGELYWLYVIEYATAPEKRKVYPIPDPAAQATAYLFDDGWVGLAEDPR
jgi:hypothetical protein